MGDAWAFPIYVLVWSGSGFIAWGFFKGLLAQVLPKTGEKYTYAYQRRANSFFWFGPLGLALVADAYRAFREHGYKCRWRFRLRMPKELKEK